MRILSTLPGVGISGLYLLITFENISCFQAYNLIEDLRSRVPKANVQLFVDTRLLEAIYKALDMPLKGLGQRQMNGFNGSPEEEDGEEVEEDVVDEIYDDDR